VAPCTTTRRTNASPRHNHRHFIMKKASEKLKLGAGVAGDKMRIISQTMKEKTSKDTEGANPEIAQLEQVLLPRNCLGPCRAER